MSSLLPPTPTGAEKILDELVGFDGNTVVARWKLTETALGQLATYMELSEEVDQILVNDNMFDHPGGREFYARRHAAISAFRLSTHPVLGAYARNLGYTYQKDPSDCVRRITTFPTADYFNNALDAQPLPHTGLRFYEPATPTGTASGPEFITKLGIGLAPYAAPDKPEFLHDAIDHGFGYALEDAQTTVKNTRRHAVALSEIGIDVDDAGLLIVGSAASNFTGVVDRLSALLTRSLLQGESKHVLNTTLAEYCGALAIAKSGNIPDRLRVRGGLVPALQLVRSIRHTGKSFKQRPPESSASQLAA